MEGIWRLVHRDIRRNVIDIKIRNVLVVTNRFINTIEQRPEREESLFSKVDKGAEESHQKAPSCINLDHDALPRGHPVPRLHTQQPGLGLLVAGLVDSRAVRAGNGGHGVREALARGAEAVEGPARVEVQRDEGGQEQGQHHVAPGDLGQAGVQPGLRAPHAEQAVLVHPVADQEGAGRDEEPLRVDRQVEERDEERLGHVGVPLGQEVGGAVEELLQLRLGGGQPAEHAALEPARDVEAAGGGRDQGVGHQHLGDLAEEVGGDRLVEGVDVPDDERRRAPPCKHQLQKQ
mmetsp:Transcript_34410/g.62826  ORF Transcript_34410/g.62826 Transcript_34410/m.62826 type:complete len:290 (-) Transcript_34410:329-1198(-)